MTGRHISHYEILDKLGEGGMGVVWKARDTRLNRVVAIKMLPADRLADEGRRRRFIQEAQAASALNDPNIVTIYEIASEGDTDFLAMEFVDGKTLGQIIPKRGMRADEILRDAIQIAGALAKAHAAGIIHRDLKPGNIMVSAEGRIKLLDFGLAKLMEPVQPSEDERTRTLAVKSEEGSIVGTAAYMSPEQAESKPVDARSDIFSFGAVLYEMATGVRAFQGDSRLSTLSAVLRDNPKPAGQIAPEVPRELDRIITRCLRKDPAKRFQAMPDLKVALEELKEESDSGSADMSVSAPPGRSRVRSGLLLGTVLVLALAAGASWTLLRPAKPLPPLQSIPLTTYPGSEESPSFSPDGTQVAFAWNGEKGDNWDIYVKLVEGGPPLRLTSSPSIEYAPAWSPDGRQIAFVKQSGGEGVYSVSPLGGPERRLTDLHTDALAWFPDSQSILISSAKSHAEPHHISRLWLATGEVKQITFPASHGNAIEGDLRPAVSPDGQNLAFVRVQQADGDLYVQPIAGGPARRVTRRSQQWVGNTWISNRDLLFCSGPLGSSGMWRIPADGHADQEPVSGALEGCRTLALFSPPGRPARVAYGRVTNDVNVWRVDTVLNPDGSVRSVTEPSLAVASTRMDQSPRLSSDGGRIVFASDRNGYLEIWAGGSDGSNPSQLTNLKASRTGSPNWSPDGRQVVFDSLASGNNDIWIVGSDGGVPRRITTETSNDARPAWSGDGRWIYFRSDRSGSQQIWKIPATEPYQPAVQVTRNAGFDAGESPDAKLLYFTKPAGGLWSMPLAGGDEQLVLADVRAAYWAVAANGIYYLDRTHPLSDGPTALLLYCFATRKSTQIAAVPKPLVPATPSLSVTPDGRHIAWAQVDHRDSDLMLIDNFH